MAALIHRRIREDGLGWRLEIGGATRRFPQTQSGSKPAFIDALQKKLEHRSLIWPDMRPVLKFLPNRPSYPDWVDGENMPRISRFINDESGATAIEYGLIASILGVLLITAFKSVGSKLTSTFNDIASNLSS